MNYPLKQILGKYDPKLLKIQHQVSWPAVNSMAQRGEFAEIQGYVKRQMAQQLALEIPLEYHETALPDTLQISAEVYAFTRKELLELLQASYTLGQDQARVLPNYSYS